MKLTCLILASLAVACNAVRLRGQEALQMSSQEFQNSLWGFGTPDKCSPESEESCDQDYLEEDSGLCENYSSSSVDGIRVGTEEHGLPEELQGVFWLTKQGDSSTIMSFAPSNDGKKFGHYQAEEDGSGIIDVRVGGDRTWAFQDKGKSWSLVEMIDLVYEFNFFTREEDGRRVAHIIPRSDRLWGLRVPRSIFFGLIDVLEFDMELYHDGEYSAEKATPDTFPQNMEDEGVKVEYVNGVPKDILEEDDIKIWKRVSYTGGMEADSAQYDLIQILKGDGTPTAAYRYWVEQCENFSEEGNFYWHRVKDENLE